MNLQLIFLIAVLVASPLVWLLPRLWQGKAMMITTAVMLLWVAPFSLALMLSSALIQWILWKKQNFGWNKAGYVLSIFLPLLPLVFFKVGSKTDSWLIPLGLSYFAFRQIHVAFEVYKKEIAIPALEEYFQYLLFLPVFLVGPIHRMPEFTRSMRRKKWQAPLFSEGMERILYGMTKVFFLGNYVFTSQLNKLASTIDEPWLRIYIKMIAFAGNAYMQFAGFSDIAIGMGLLWGIRVIENFNHPFLATNMQEFWQRWHISLSSWCRDYVFHPVNALFRNRWLALVLSMLVLALWHEISLRYIAWGLFHTMLILLTVQFRKISPPTSRFINDHAIGKWIGRVWVFHLFAFSCLFIGAIDNEEMYVQLNNLVK